MNMLLSLLSGALLRIPDGESKTRCYLKMMNFLLLIITYILACIGLYYYWVPTWGTAFSLFGIALTLLATSLLLCFIRWCLKPKATPLTKANALMERTLGHVTSAPLPVIATVAVGAAVFYLLSSRAKALKL